MLVLLAMTLMFKHYHSMYQKYISIEVYLIDLCIRTLSLGGLCYKRYQNIQVMSVSWHNMTYVTIYTFLSSCFRMSLTRPV
jgi:hypothetical protein